MKIEISLKKLLKEYFVSFVQIVIINNRQSKEFK